MTPFEPGRACRRTEEIHAVFGGQRQGGISTPAHGPCLFLFAAESGSEYGYEGGF